MDAPVPPQPPQNLQALIALRDRVEDYLSTTERNTAAVKSWFSANKDRIILFHHRLNRALENKNDAKATALLAEMNDSGIAGFVLSLQDFSKKAKASLGADSAFLKAAAAIPPGLPAKLQEPVPDLPAFDADILVRLEKDRQQLKAEDARKQPLSVSSWFHKEEKRLEEQAREARRQSHTVKDEILGLQDDRHYYIDSLMDWVVDTLAPDPAEKGGVAASDDAKMLQYQDLSYIINTATADHREAVENGAAVLRDAAREYSALAETIDQQDTQAILKKIATAYPAAATEDSALFQKILLEDFQSVSLPEIIMKHIHDRDSQAVLLDWVFKTPGSGQITFADAPSAKQVVEKFVNLTLDKNDPLDPRILQQIITLAREGNKITAESIAFDNRNIFQAAATRFAGKPAAQKNVLSAVLTGMGSKITGSDDAYVAFSESLRRKDTAALLNTLKEIEQRHLTLPFSALWYLCRPGTSLVDSLCAATPDPVLKATLLEQGLKAGLLGELWVENSGTTGSAAAAKFKELVEKDIFPALETIPVNTVRLLISHSFPSGSLFTLRGLLTQPPARWLEKIAASAVDDDKKTEWIAALLEPFKSDIVRANILAEARSGCMVQKNANILSAMEKNLVGENIRLTEDKILCNLQRIANIWYNADSKMLRYTVQGQSHTLLESLSPAMAKEILTLIQRRGDFMTERDGLFKPENIDAIHYSPQGTTVSWYHVTGSLNADNAAMVQLKKRTDFIHATDADTGLAGSYNIASICLLQEMDDGTTLMIDKYGTAHMLEGKVVPKEGGPLVNIGAAYFNPDNASILRLNPKDKTFEFRIESPDFEKLLDPQEEQYFYSIALPSAAAFAALKKSINGSADIHAPNDTDLANLYLNMKALEYLAYDEKASGFYCKKYSATRKPGFIHVEPDMAAAILEGIGHKRGMIRVGDLLAHKDSIDDAYYSSGQHKLQLVTGSEIQEIPADTTEGWGMLLLLAKDKKFVTVSRENYTVNDNDMPTDVVQIGRATLLSLNASKDKMNIITEHMPFPVGLGSKEALAFLDALEEKGLAATRVATPALAWTKNLGAALSALPETTVNTSLLPATSAPAALLKQALEQAGAADTSGKKPAADFAAAAPAKKQTASQKPAVALEPKTQIPPPFRSL